MKPLLENEWPLIESLLPEGWRELGWECGALKNRKGITDPSVLLSVLLLHAATGLSLRQTSARAKAQGLAEISDVGILKRLRNAGPWLEAMARAMFRDSRFGRRAPKISVGRRVLVTDATTVEEPGASGTSWRVHYALRLPDLVCDQFEITDASGGETFRRFRIQRGDIVLGDRGYSQRAGVAHVVDSGADVVMRLNSGTFPLLHRRGGAFQLLQELRTLKGHRASEWKVRFEYGERSYPVRLCAIRKTRDAAERARRKLRQDAGSKSKTLRPETLELCDYVVVLTSLSSQEYSTDEVLELYRARWQVELAFKRLKSLLKLGHVPKTNDDSARAWIAAKLLVVLLTERLLEDARSFSPWGFALAATKPVA